MIKAQIVKKFHRSSRSGVLQRGDVFNETMTFHSFESVVRWARGVNKNHATVDYTIVSVAHDTRFLSFDTSDIYSKYAPRDAA